MFLWTWQNLCQRKGRGLCQWNVRDLCRVTPAPSADASASDESPRAATEIEATRWVVASIGPRWAAAAAAEASSSAAAFLCCRCATSRALARDSSRS